jgi:dUTPase
LGFSSGFRVIAVLNVKNKPKSRKLLGTGLKTRIQQLITKEELENPG